MVEKNIFIDMNDIVKAKVVIQGSNGQTTTPRLKGQKTIDTFTSIPVVAEQVETNLQKEFTTWAKFNWSNDEEGAHPSSYNSYWNTRAVLDYTINSDYRIEFTFYDDITDTYSSTIDYNDVFIIGSTNNGCLSITNTSYYSFKYLTSDSYSQIIKNRSNGEHAYIYNDVNAKCWMDGVEVRTCEPQTTTSYKYVIGQYTTGATHGWTGYMKEYKLISNSTNEVICDIKPILLWQNGEEYQKISALYDTINDKIYYPNALECMNEIKQNNKQGYLKSYYNYGKFSYEERVLATYKELTDIPVNTNHQLILNFYDDTSKESIFPDSAYYNEMRMALANTYSNPSGYLYFKEDNYYCCSHPHSGYLPVSRTTGHHTFIFNNENSKMTFDGIEIGDANPVDWNYYQLGSQLFSGNVDIKFVWYLESFQIISKTTGDLIADIVPALRWKEDDPSKKEYCLYDRSRNIYYTVNNLVCMNSID
jgi:hypothetical protein